MGFAVAVRQATECILSKASYYQAMAWFSPETYKTSFLIDALIALNTLTYMSEYQWTTTQVPTDDYIHLWARRAAIKALHERGIRTSELPPIPDQVPPFAEWKAREELKKESALPAPMAIDIPTTPPTESPPVTLCSCFR